MAKPELDWLETLPYFRRKAVHCMRSGWTRDQATGRNSEYGWTRSLHGVDRRPLSWLAMREAELSADRAMERMCADLDRYLESTGRLVLASIGVAA